MIHVGNRSRLYCPSSGFVDTVSAASAVRAEEAVGIPGFLAEFVSLGFVFLREVGIRVEVRGPLGWSRVEFGCVFESWDV